MFAVVSCIFGFIEVVLSLKFLLLLFAANPAVPFVMWVYNISYPFVAPFNGIFGQPGTAVATAGIHSVFDVPTLVALVVYAAIGGFLAAAFGRRPNQPVM